jgi:hypothetical protein
MTKYRFSYEPMPSPSRGPWYVLPNLPQLAQGRRGRRADAAAARFCFRWTRTWQTCGAVIAKAARHWSGERLSGARSGSLIGPRSESHTAVKATDYRLYAYHAMVTS